MEVADSSTDWVLEGCEYSVIRHAAEPDRPQASPFRQGFSNLAAVFQPRRKRSNRLLEHVDTVRRGVRVSVVSSTSTQPPMIADELRRQADQFVDIVELQPKISRDPAERAARETREPRHMPQFLQRGTTPQGAGADEEESEG